MNGSTLEKARKIRNIKQEVVAERLGLSQSQYSKLINAEKLPDNFDLDRFAKSIDVSKEWILTLEDRINITQNIEKNEGFAFVMNNYQTSDASLIAELNKIIVAQNEIITNLKIVVNNIKT